MLREQIHTIQAMQRRVAWVNYVHEMILRDPAGDTQKRRRELVLAMPEGPTRKSELRLLNPELAEMYAGKSDKTMTRDLNRLQDLELLRRQANAYLPAIDVMDAFIPISSPG